MKTLLETVRSARELAAELAPLFRDFGFPLVLLVFIGVGGIRSGRFFAPRVARFFQAHTRLVETLRKTLKQQARDSRRQTRLMQATAPLLHKIDEQTSGCPKLKQTPPELARA